MHLLADFLNHGVLPFLGRARERDRVVAFWRGTFEATELRAMLMLGEAGVGKSRLLDDAMLRIVESGGSVVHVKLYPESAVGLLELTARALWHPNAARTILAAEPPARLPDVAGALQRLARLRPTLLVIEDIHLLSADAVAELARLLRQVADETLSMLVLARPVELAARPSLEQYLVDEIVIGGLSEDGCGEIWEAVTGAPIGDDVRAALLDATAGNPLALRSALRGALRGIVADPVGATAKWRTLSGRDDLVRTLRRSVGLLAEGMTADIEPHHLDAARRLATLGEVFARESASIMLDGDVAMLETLVFNGLIATAVAPPAALPLEPSAHAPLAFTHTLLHRELVRTATLDGERLARVLSNGPLYSLVPFTLLAAAPITTSGVEMMVMRRAFNRALQVEIAVQRTAHWRSASIAWDVAVRILESRLGEWEQPDWEEKIVRLAHHKVNLVRRSAPAELSRWLDHLKWLSTDASSDELTLGRLHEIANRCILLGHDEAEAARGYWVEVQSLAVTRPHLQDTFPFVECIIALCMASTKVDDDRMLRSIEERMEELLGTTLLTPIIRAAIETKVRPQFLRLFESAVEVDARLRFIDHVVEHVDRSDLGVWMFCMSFLSDAALVDRFSEHFEVVTRGARDQGLLRPALNLALRELVLRAGRGLETDAIVAKLEARLTELPAALSAPLEAACAPGVIDALLLRDDLPSARAVAARPGVDRERLGAHRLLLLGLVDEAQAGGAIRDRLSAPVLRLGDVVEVLAAHALRSARSTDDTRAVREDDDRALAERTSEAIEWLLAPGRALPAYATTLIDRARSHGGRRSITAWEQRVRELDGGIRDVEVAATDDGPWRISMIGSIGARRGEREPRLQGARARSLLAVMVASEMLGEPLSSAEFARLVAGDETMAIENARNIQKTTVHRLREALGQETVLTDGTSPRLNAATTEVDLLIARDNIEAARAALRAASPMQARPAIMAALAIVGGNVVFPSLYDDFIEALREDFENQLRMTALDVARALLREGGAADATEILRSAATALPGDGEIAELLQECLATMGRRADAVRVERAASAE